MLLTADHKVLCKENEPRLQHRYAVVVRDLYSYCIQLYPTKNHTAQETMKKFADDRAARSENQVLNTQIIP